MGVVGKDFIVFNQRGFTLPSEMQLCAAMEASPSPIPQHGMYNRIEGRVHKAYKASSITGLC